MTDIRPSPEMLDAAAANRREAAQPLEERDLSQAIELHRQLFHADLWIARLHDRDGESGIGPPFSAPFANYLDDRLGMFPWSKAMFALRYAVCRHHPEHQSRSEWQGGLCYRLVDLVVRREWSLDMARLELGLPHEWKTRRTLDSALLTIERTMEDDYRKQQEPAPRPASEWMATPHIHSHPPGTSLEDCPNADCRKVA